MNIIETQHLTKNYGRTRGIVDLNLQVPEGDFFGFIGPNGAGKSTTIRTLLGLIRPTSGTFRIPDRQEIGYMPSESLFYKGMRVREVLHLSASLHHKDCVRQAAELCQRLDLDPTRKVDDLSLGNRKKVGIVCALQHEPKLYILDEPTSGLDLLIQREFYRLLQERNAQGATVFLSCHVLSEVQRYCHQAAVIREGRLLSTLDRDDLSAPIEQLEDRILAYYTK